MEVAIIRYNAGNVQSVVHALDKLSVRYKVTDNVEEIKKADKVIFPGVGEASTAMNYLKANNLDKLIPSLKQPVFGVCLGLQLMCEHSEENNTECLGIFNLEVKRFEPKLKVPHMGWNNLMNCKGDLFKNIGTDPYVYFVHGYYAPVSETTVASADYINPFSAALQKDNFFAVQFHPEKSSTAGLKIIKNFIEL
jgi:imidazole glycerol-phosphate synthase subunit HisH